ARLVQARGGALPGVTARRGSGKGGRALACFETGLYGAIDEAGPAVREIRAGEEDAALGAAHLSMVAGVPARPVDRPGSARVLVGEPVVRGRRDELVAWEDLVERVLHRASISRIAAPRAGAEADLELRAIAEQGLGVEVTERVAWPDRVLEHIGTAG